MLEREAPTHAPRFHMYALTKIVRVDCTCGEWKAVGHSTANAVRLHRKHVRNS